MERIQIRPDPSHSHYQPTTELLRQIQDMGSDATPAVVKMRGEKLWLWGEIMDLSPARGVFTIRLAESRAEHVLDIHDVEIMVLHEGARRFVNSCDQINAYIAEHGRAAARHALEGITGAQPTNAFDQLHPVPSDDDPPPAA